MIITTNADTKRRLELASKDAHVVILSAEQTVEDDQYFNHVGYLKLLVRRTQILNLLIQHDFETFLFEFNFLWIKNHVPLLHSYDNQYDMLFIGNYYEPNSINGGFVYMFPTNTTRQVLHILVEQMVNPAEHIQGLSNKDEVPEKENDQVYLSKLVREEYAGLKHFVLPYSYFTEGVWYTMTKEKKLTLDPFVIHNDYVSGNDKKINRVKQFGHWFLNNDNTCNYQKVNSILNNYIQLIQTYSLAP